MSKAMKSAAVRVLDGHTEAVNGVAAVVTLDGTRAVSASTDGTLRVWDLATGEAVATLQGHTRSVRAVAVTADGSRAVSASTDGTLRVWDLATGEAIATLQGHTDTVWGVAISADGSRAVSASDDHTLRVWDLETLKAIATLQGHTNGVWGVAVTADGSRAVSASYDETLRVWDLNVNILRENSYTNAKVMFVGEPGAGKSGLVRRLVHNLTPEGKSTDAGWATQLELPHDSSTETIDREIWLWDFGGQADYRLIHQLYMDDTALAVFVFDAQKDDAFSKLAEWDRAITAAAGGKPFRKLLVSGKCDVCAPKMTMSAIQTFANDHGFERFIATSAETGDGCDTLKRAIVDTIDWINLPATVTTPTFRRLKELILKLKERSTAKPGEAPPLPVVMTQTELEADLRNLLSGSNAFENTELNTVVRLLKAPGAVWPLVDGERVLLQPERISHYASAVVRTIRNRTDGMGYIPEDDVLMFMNIDQGQLERLPVGEEVHVVRAMYQYLLDRPLCLREARKGESHLLVFPHLFKLEQPKPDESNPLVTYEFAGLLDDAYATLVVGLHHTELVNKKQLWLDAADFETEVGKKVLGLKMTRKHEGRAAINVYANHDVSEEVFVPFVEYVHEHLKSKDPKVVRHRHYTCMKCGQLQESNRPVELARMNKRDHVFCGYCGVSISLDDALERRYLSEETAETVQTMLIQTVENLDTESKGRLLVGLVTQVVAEADQIFREMPQDHGIDGEIEFKRPDATKGAATGKKVYLQLKSGDSYLYKRQRDNTEVFAVDREHARYWQDQPCDVWLVVRTKEAGARWMNATTYLKEHGRNGREVKQIVFAGLPFDAAAVRKLRDQVIGTG